jgi:predicted patatin/cPLA2 family phospholipase
LWSGGAPESGARRVDTSETDLYVSAIPKPTPALHRAGDNPVLDLLQRRLASGSRPHARDPGDDARLALVIEGGGMRGVVAAGMVTALQELGIRDQLDLVVGTSAGAMAGAFYLAGQPRMGTSLYYEDLIGRDWLDYRRVLRRRPIISLDYLIDTLMTSRKVLDCERVLGSDIPLYAVATRTGSYESEVLGDFASAEELLHALRASARIPIAAGGPVEVGEARYLDGSVAESIPVDTAVDRLGATHVLALRTRPAGHLRGRASALQRLLVHPLMNLVEPGLGTAYGERPVRYREEVERLEAMQAGRDPSGSAFSIQIPAEAPGIGQIEQDPAALFAGAAAGAAAVYLALTGERKRFYAGLSLVD